jgi:hypothetical protein
MELGSREPAFRDGLAPELGDRVSPASGPGANSCKAWARRIHRSLQYPALYQNSRLGTHHALPFTRRCGAFTIVPQPGRTVHEDPGCAAWLHVPSLQVILS